MIESGEQLDLPRDFLGQLLAFGIEWNSFDGVETGVQFIAHLDDVTEPAFADPT